MKNKKNKIIKKFTFFIGLCKHIQIQFTFIFTMVQYILHHQNNMYVNE